ncbi:MAG: hypothetical protein GX467_06880 [Rikenellaceae bacterium]|nr:hypothetical protein [Rikenellaceae bacterium]
MRLKLVILLSIAFGLGSCTSHKESDDNRLILWFDRPAQSWMTEGLPVGNGYMGVMFMGDPAIEHIQFAEESLWAGGPNSGTQYDFGIKKGGVRPPAKDKGVVADGRYPRGLRPDRKMDDRHYTPTGEFGFR